MSGFNGGGSGDLDDYFMTTTELIDRFGQGGLMVWGGSYQGETGTNDQIFRSTPSQIPVGGTNWKQISASQNISTAIKTDGTLWTWGRNEYGQLGTNDRVHRSTPTQTTAGGTNWKQIYSGIYTTAAIKTDGTLWAWGHNSYGQLGINDIVHRSTPVQVFGGATNWKQVAGANFGTFFTAIKTDGTLWTWGRNFYGGLGTNDTVSRSTPVQTIAGGTNWKQVACGYGNFLAIKTDGTLWGCGYNFTGELGINDTANRSTPVQTIAGGTNWKQVAGFGSMYAIKTDGTLWAWGHNGNGQLGTNDINNRSTPVQTIAGGTNWKQVAPAESSAFAIKTDGTLWGWGWGSAGVLGTNDQVNRSTPTQVFGRGNNWKSVAGGSRHCLAIQTSNI